MEPATVARPGDGLGARMVAKLPGGDRLPAPWRVVVVLVVLALLVLVAFATAPWGFIALGCAVALLVAAGVGAAQAGLAPVAALGAAALPLLLPVVVFVAAGVVKSPPQVQFAVGFVALLLAWGLIRPEWSRLGSALRRRPRQRSARRGAVQVGLPIVVAVSAFLFVGDAVVGLLGDSDHVARGLFVAAVGALVLALALRAIGYASTAFRTAVALSLLALLARLAIAIGLIGGGPFGDISVSAFALVAGGALALTVLVEVATSILAGDAAAHSGVAADELPTGLRTAVVLETPVTARWVTDRLSVAGLGFSLLSALLLLCAVFSASHAGGADEDPRAVRAGEPPIRPAGLPDARLAATYAPVLLFTSDEPFRPTTVDAYVHGATLTDWQGRRMPVRGVGDLPSRCPGVVRAPCFRLAQRCRAGSSPLRCAEALPQERAVYVRVARRGQWQGCRAGRACADGSPDPFARAAGPYAAQTQILLQYWLFYPYNLWNAAVAVGDLKEIHAADWEAVTVGLSAGRPLWVAYSQHCAGTYADWSEIRAAPSDPAHLRPLVAVAEGSQANYRVARQSRVPNFAECSGITQDRLKLISYAANIRDRTDDAATWAPSAADLRLVDARTPPMSFAGTWAPFARMELDTLHKAIRLGPDGAGPASPPLQPLWDRPMNVIFSGRAWGRG